MSVIDWLELLWKAAEEGQEFDLPGESDLLPVRTGDPNWAEENGEISPVQSFAEEAEPRNSVWRNQTQLETVEPKLEESYLRSVLQAVKRPVGGSTVQQSRRSADGSAVEMLYRRVREMAFPRQPGAPGRSGTVVVRDEVPATPGLTEEGLDRSRRRDSRRYDGGMSIY